MNNDNNETGTDKHLTRAQYRRQMKQEQGLFSHHPNEETTDDPQLHGDPDQQAFTEPTAVNTSTNDGSAAPNRATSLAMDKETVAEEKSQRLARKLNIAIAVLVALIVVVYLVLFFVG